MQDTETSVIQDIRERQAKGILKYGTTVARNQLELREWLQHGYEEALDMAIYLKRAMQQLDSTSQGQSSQANLSFPQSSG